MDLCSSSILMCRRGGPILIICLSTAHGTVTKNKNHTELPCRYQEREVRMDVGLRMQIFIFLVLVSEEP